MASINVHGKLCEWKRYFSNIFLISTVSNQHVVLICQKLLDHHRIDGAFEKEQAVVEDIC